MKKITRQIVLFFTGGAIGSLLYYGTYYAVLYFFKEYYLLAGITARVLNSLFNFYTQRKWVFEGKEKSRQYVLRFGALSVLLVLTNTLFLYLFVEGIDGDPAWAPFFIWIPQSYIAFTLGKHIFTTPS